jgi:hypothetical protein
VAFFGALTVQSLVRPNKRSYIPSLLLVDFGILNSLVRNVFFFDLSPHPARLGGMWRLASALVVGWGVRPVLPCVAAGPALSHAVQDDRRA